MWWIASAGASTVPLTPAERCELAELAVVARVEGVRTAPGAGGLLERTVTLAVEGPVVAGRTVPSTLDVVSLGGTLGGVTQRVEDQPDWVPGQRYVVLALRWQGAWRPVDAAAVIALPPPELDPTGRIGATVVARAREACRG